MYYKCAKQLSFILLLSKDSSAKYYQKNKERLQKKACERYQDLSEVEKNKKPQYECKWYQNLPEDEKKYEIWISLRNSSAKYIVNKHRGNFKILQFSSAINWKKNCWRLSRHLYNFVGNGFCMCQKFAKGYDLIFNIWDYLFYLN